MEAERLRPGLDELLDEADYIVTSAHFPQASAPFIDDVYNVKCAEMGAAYHCSTHFSLRP